ncbi:MAG: hypothetical protein ACOX61_09650 [Brooklawnia sp.]|jgi:hypothetical protein
MATPNVGDTAYYALQPRTPARAWVLAVSLIVVGVVLVLAGGLGETRNTVLLVIGVVVGLVGVAMAIAAAAFVQSRTLHVRLTPEGYEVNGPGYHKQGAWMDVDAVSATPDGARLVIARGQVDRTFIQAPGGRGDARMRALSADIAGRLQAFEH